MFIGHPLLRINMLTLDIFGPTRHFGWFQDGRHEKKTKCLAYSFNNISLLPSVMLTFMSFMSGPSLFKIFSSIADIKKLNIRS